MKSKVLMTIHVVMLLACGSVWSQPAEDSNVDLNVIVEEALDQAEGGIVKEPAMSYDPMSAPSEDTEQPEVLEEIVIDENGPVITTLETKEIPLLHAEAASILEALEEFKSIDGEVLYNQQNRTLVLKDSKDHLDLMTDYIKKVDIPLETEIFKLNHIGADEVVDKVKKTLTKSVGQVQVDESANTIVATDTPVKIGRIRDLITGIDVIDKEIRIEAKILQIVLNDEHLEGVDWEAIVSEYRSLDFEGFHRRDKGDAQQRLDLGAVTDEDYEILLDALDTVGVVNDVSNDVISTENEGTKTVSILSSLLKEFQMPRSDPGENGDAENDERVELHITPEVKRDGVITVTIKPEHKNGQFEPADGVSADIRISDGDTIVIGHLFKEVMVESTWKIPLLGDLPLLGFVFRNQGQKSRRSEIIAFLTVKTVSRKRTP